MRNYLFFNFQLKDEIHELKLEQLQKQLELKEVATRKRLFALRQELEPVGSSQTEVCTSVIIKNMHVAVFFLCVRLFLLCYQFSSNA